MAEYDYPDLGPQDLLNDLAEARQTVLESVVGTLSEMVALNTNLGQEWEKEANILDHINVMADRLADLVPHLQHRLRVKTHGSKTEIIGFYKKTDKEVVLWPLPKEKH